MNPYAILAIVLAFVISVSAAGAGGFKLGMDHEKATEVDKNELVSEAVDAATSAAATAISSLKIKNTTITNEVQHEVRTNTVYVDCKLPPSGVRLLNAALDPSAAFSIGDGKLPQVDPAK